MFQLSGHENEPVKMRLELDKYTDTTKSIIPQKCKNIYQSLIESHAESIQSGKLLHGSDGYHNLLLCEAAHKSAQNGGKIITIKG